jgi:hypothetical protein
MADMELMEQLRRDLPALLREHPEVRHELWGIMLEAFPSRQEFMALLDEMRAMREDSNRRYDELRRDMNTRFEAADRRFEALQHDMNARFEAADRRFEALQHDMNARFEAVDRRFEALQHDMNARFEAVDRRFEAVDRRFEAVDRRFEAIIEELRSHGRQLRELNIHLSALGGRVGHGLEDMVKAVVEEFAGHTFPFAEHLVLRDETGEVFGVAGAEVEFDLYAHNGEAYLVEVKSHLKTSDVLSFHQKAEFARKKLGQEIIPLLLALSMDTNAETVLRTLGIRYRVRATVAR